MYITKEISASDQIRWKAVETTQAGLHLRRSSSSDTTGRLTVLLYKKNIFAPESLASKTDQKHSPHIVWTRE